MILCGGARLFGGNVVVPAGHDIQKRTQFQGIVFENRAWQTELCLEENNLWKPFILQEDVYGECSTLSRVCLVLPQLKPEEHLIAARRYIAERKDSSLIKVEVCFLSNYVRSAEEHQDRLERCPNDYCHIPEELMNKYRR